MIPPRAITAALLLLGGAALAQTPLPPGLTQQGGVIMMEPVDSGAMSPAFCSVSNTLIKPGSLTSVCLASI